MDYLSLLRLPDIFHFIWQTIWVIGENWSTWSNLRLNMSISHSGRHNLRTFVAAKNDIFRFQIRKVLLHHWNHQIWLLSDEFCRAVGLSWPDQQHLREVIFTCKQNNEQPILRMTFNSMMFLFSHCISYPMDVLYWNTRQNTVWSQSWYSDIERIYAAQYKEEVYKSII